MQIWQRRVLLIVQYHVNKFCVRICARLTSCNKVVTKTMVNFRIIFLRLCCHRRKASGIFKKCWQSYIAHYCSNCINFAHFRIIIEKFLRQVACEI